MPLKEAPLSGGEPQVAWLETETGMELRLIFPGLHQYNLSTEAWHRMHQTYQRLTAVVSMLLEDQERMKARGRSLEGSLSFLSTHMLDVASFFQMMAGDLGPTPDDDFPF